MAGAGSVEAAREQTSFSGTAVLGTPDSKAVVSHSVMERISPHLVSLKCDKILKNDSLPVAVINVSCCHYLLHTRNLNNCHIIYASLLGDIKN